jgi:hypothetical protein
MNYRGAITKDMSRLLALLSSRCTDRETIDWLQHAASDRGKWHDAHGIFNHIRSKFLKAEHTGNANGAAQYRFEEACAKTLYNLSGAAAPFDSDSPYWIVPNAMAFARRVGLPEAEVLACVTLQGEERDA